jgi:SPP1 gp7 family putative phage head morphogenesis protein
MASPFGAFSGDPSERPGSPLRPSSHQPLTLDARRSRPGARRKERVGKPHALPLQIEIAFGKRIDALFDRLARKALSAAKARARALTQDASESEIAGLARTLQAENDFGLDEAKVLVGEVANHNARQLARSLRAVRPADEAKSIAIQVPELARQNVKRLAKRSVREIKSISKSIAERLAPVIEKAVSEGLRGEVLALELERRLGIERAAAKRLAIGQVIRINSAVTRERHEKLGVTEYIWRSTDDQHTRAWHRKLNRTRQRYDSPPVGGGGGPKDRGHPGSADVCRCQALPVIP